MAKATAESDWQVEAEPTVVETRPAETPVTPEQIVEAALFVGGPPIAAEKFRSSARLPVEVVQAAVDSLNRRYRLQRRPYSIHTKDGGYCLTVRPEFRGLREKLFGGPREARLSQQALDVLSLIAYRQPIEKSEIDSLRGFDSGGVLRQLVRLGLACVLRRGETGRSEVSYGTTPRFLDLFHLASLDDLPRLGESEVS